MMQDSLPLKFVLVDVFEMMQTWGTVSSTDAEKEAV